MQEFSSISVSSYEAGSLADRLTEQSRDGWSVVAIVPSGSTVTAYLCRETDGSVEAPAAVVEPAAEPANEWSPETEAALASAFVAGEQTETEPSLGEVAPAASGEPSISEPAISEPSIAEPAAEPAAEPVAETSTATTAGAAPAGWYADPSGRFELRYWDGGQWTEHVSRAGQQYTDPPVA